MVVNNDLVVRFNTKFDHLSGNTNPMNNLSNKLNILLVEDNVSFAVEIEMIINELDYRLVKVVDNAEEALQIIKTSPPDLIIVDISLKGKLTGIDLIEKIKALPIAVIFITQYRDEALYNKAKSLRPVAYLVKPFDKITLQSCIETAMDMVTKSQDKSDDSDDTNHYLIKDSIFVKKNNIYNKVQITEIVYIMADGNYCEFFLRNNKKFAIKMSMSKILDRFPENTFIRTHKRYAVQSALIDGLNISESKIMIGEHTFPIGRTYKENIISRLNRL